MSVRFLVRSLGKLGEREGNLSIEGRILSISLISDIKCTLTGFVSEYQACLRFRPPRVVMQFISFAVAAFYSERRREKVDNGTRGEDTMRYIRVH